MKKAPTATSLGDVTLCGTDRLEALTVLRGGEYCIINTAGYDFRKWQVETPVVWLQNR